jgi:TRAP-type C4-dicarboxylate transport system substrate-binding protein
MIAWSKVGWVRFFSKAPVFVPADLKKQKLGSDQNDTALLEAFKAMGYNMVGVPQSQILVSLTGGQIDAVYLSPVMAGGTQAFGLAKNMASINVAPFLGAVVMNEVTWRRIPEKYRDTLIRIAKSHEDTMDRQILAMENEVIQMMKTHGLVVNTVTPAQAQLWYADVRQVLPRLYGGLVDKAMYDRVEGILQNYRKTR